MIHTEPALRRLGYVKFSEKLRLVDDYGQASDHATHECDRRKQITEDHCAGGKRPSHVEVHWRCVGVVVAVARIGI